jgi:hypothetical protein
MRRRLFVSGTLVLTPAGYAIAQPILPSEVGQPIAFAWSGPVEGATRALAARLGYSTWASTAAGLPPPDPVPIVNVTIGVASVSAAGIVEILNRQCRDRAVIVLDPEQRSIGVVYHA